jgi:hypothetical protein
MRIYLTNLMIASLFWESNIRLANPKFSVFKETSMYITIFTRIWSVQYAEPVESSQ